MKRILNYHPQLTLLCLFVLLLVSCSKKEDPTPEEMLTGGSSKAWKYSVMKENGVTQTLDDDAKAERLTFNKNGTFIWVYPDRTDNGEWQLTNGAKTLRIREKVDPNTWGEYIDIEVLKLTSSELVLYIDRDLGSSNEITMVPAN